jgi:transcriptional regulator with XRE-family HTH domain
MNHDIAYTSNGSNLFADGGLPDAAALYVKSRLCAAIRREMEKQGITQTELAKRSGVHQPRISRICRHHTEDISVDVILRVVEALGYDVEPALIKREPGKTVYADESLSTPKPARSVSPKRDVPRTRKEKVFA